MVIDTGSLAYEVEAPMNTFYNLPKDGEQVSLITHYYVREDRHTLYGFTNESERDVFRILIRIAGVGPRLALAILSGMSIYEFKKCIDDNDIAMLRRLPGVGMKTAERLSLEMRGKFPNIETGVLHTAGDQSARYEAVSVLVALGYALKESKKAVSLVPASVLSIEQIVKSALGTMLAK